MNAPVPSQAQGRRHHLHFDKRLSPCTQSFTCSPHRCRGRKMPDAQGTNQVLPPAIPTCGRSSPQVTPCADGQTELVEEGAQRGRRPLLFPEALVSVSGAAGARTQDHVLVCPCRPASLPAASLAGAS